MKLHLEPDLGLNRFTRLGADHVVVNTERFAQNVLVLADRVTPLWTAHTFETLDEGDFRLLAGCGADIVLLGTGTRQRFLHARLRLWKPAARIALEVMTTAAACRTYNILVSEGRRAAAALLIEKP